MRKLSVNLCYFFSNDPIARISLKAITKTGEICKLMRPSSGKAVLAAKTGLNAKSHYFISSSGTYQINCNEGVLDFSRKMP